MYSVVVGKSANKELQELPNIIVSRLISLIKSLSINPRPIGCKKLKGNQNLWRVRSGDYRIIYSIDDAIKIVDVRKIGHRKEIYE
jgi:mRNA interferase RelE/StbE